MAEWLKATDCKSVPARVRWFESTPAQLLKRLREGSFFIAEVSLTTVVVLPSIASICLLNFNLLFYEKRDIKSPFSASQRSPYPCPVTKKTPKGVFFYWVDSHALSSAQWVLPSIASIRFLRLHLFFHEKRDI